MERVEADLRVGEVLANRFLIAARHVDRDRADRALALAEQIEEGLQRGGVAARCAPHDRPSPVVDDRGQVALAAAVADLVDADRDQTAQAPLVEVVFDDALDDPPDGVPADPQQAGDRCLGHLLREPRHDVLEVEGVLSIGPRPGHPLEVHAAVAAAQPAQLALDHAAVGAEVEMTPALQPPVVDLEPPAGLPATRTHPPPAPQSDGHDHPLGAEADVDNRCSGQAEHPRECGLDAHAVLLCRRLSFNTHQPATGRRRVQSALRKLRTKPQPRIPCSRGPTRAPFTPKTTGDPNCFARWDSVAGVVRSKRMSRQR